jgi:hypothetical protein
MNWIKSSQLAVPALALAAALAWVQPASSQNADAPGRGSITMDQFVARQTSRIMAADTDGDGRISRAEMAALAAKGPNKGRHDPEHRFDAMDTNHDGYLDKDEIRSALEKRFRRMDLNGDGVLTPDERMAGRSQRQSPDDRPNSPAMSAASQP